MFLGFTCAFNKGEIALFNDDYKLVTLKKSEGEQYHSFALKELDDIFCKHNITFNDVKGLITNTGPGASFTGLRVSVSLVKTIALTQNIPLFSVDSMNLMYREVLTLHKYNDSVIMVCLNGFQNRVFIKSYYKGQGLGEIKDVVLSEIESEVESVWKEHNRKVPVTVIGNGVDLINQNNSALMYAPNDFTLTDVIKEPSIRFIEKEDLVKVSFEEFEPQYYRLPQAQENIK